MPRDDYSFDSYPGLNVRQRSFEKIYLAVFAIYAMMVFLETTMFGERIWPDWLRMGLRLFLVVFVLAKLCFVDKDFRPLETAVMAAVVLVFAASWFYVGREGAVETAFLIVGAKGVSGKKIAAAFLLIDGSAMLYTIAMALWGVIPNLAYDQTGRSVMRLSLGFDYPTNFAAHLFFLAAVYLWLRAKPHPAESLLFWAGGAFVLRFCDARMDTACLVVLGVICLFAGLFPGKEKRTWLVNLALFLTAAVAAGSLLLPIFYREETGWMNRLNVMLSGRLALGHEAFMRYSHTLLGQAVVETGFERSTVPPINYFYIDSSYVSIYLKYGLIGLAIVLFLIGWCMKREEKSGMAWHAWIWLVIVVQGMIEPHLFDLAYNPFLLLSFATLSGSRKELNASASRKTRIASPWPKNKQAEGKKRPSLGWAAGYIFLFALALLAGRHWLGEYETYDSKTQYPLEDYGINPDGNDCTDALQNLIDDVYRKGGGELVFDEGTYQIRSLTLRSRVSLCGQGKGKTVLSQAAYHPPGENEILALLYCPKEYNMGIGIKGMTLSGTVSESDKPMAGIAFEHDYSMGDGSFSYADEGSSKGDRSKQIVDVEVQGFSGDGILIGIGRSDVYLKQVQIQNNGGDGLSVCGLDNEITEVLITQNAHNGLYVADSGNKIRHVWSTKNCSDGGQYWGIYLKASGCSMTDSLVMENYSGGISIVGDDNQVERMVSDSNGTPDGLSDSVLFFVSGKRNRVSGTCMQTLEAGYPYAAYSLIMSECKDCRIDVEIEGECARLGAILDEEQLVSDSTQES